MSGLDARREALLRESARQRQALNAHLEGLKPAARLVDPALRLASFVRRRPLLSAALSLMLTRMLRRHRWVRRAGSLALLWRAMRGLLRWFGHR